MEIQYANVPICQCADVDYGIRLSPSGGGRGRIRTYVHPLPPLLSFFSFENGVQQRQNDGGLQHHARGHHLPFAAFDFQEQADEYEQNHEHKVKPAAVQGGIFFHFRETELEQDANFAKLIK